MLKKQIINFLYLTTLLITLGWMFFYGIFEHLSFHFTQSMGLTDFFYANTIIFLFFLLLHMLFLYHTICKKLELTNCFVLQTWFAFTLIVLIKYDKELDTLLEWGIFSMLLSLLYNLKEKEKIFGNVLLAGILCGISVVLLPSGWIFSLVTLGLIIIWAILTPRTLLIFIMGWTTIFLYIGVFFFVTNQFSVDRIVDLIHFPTVVSGISVNLLLFVILLALAFFFMFFSFVEYKISSRKMYLCLMLFFIFTLFTLTTGNNEMLAMVLYPFWIVLNKFLQNYERKWWWWMGSILPLLIFVGVFFFF